MHLHVEFLIMEAACPYRLLHNFMLFSSVGQPFLKKVHKFQQCLESQWAVSLYSSTVLFFLFLPDMEISYNYL